MYGCEKKNKTPKVFQFKSTLTYTNCHKDIFSHHFIVFVFVVVFPHFSVHSVFDVFFFVLSLSKKKPEQTQKTYKNIAGCHQCYISKKTHTQSTKFSTHFEGMRKKHKTKQNKRKQHKI